MKRAFAALALLIFAAHASALGVSQYAVSINVAKDGYAAFEEKYYLKFAHGFEQDEFAADAAKNGSSLDVWAVDYNFFYPHFGRGNLKRSSVSFDSELGVLTLSYELLTPFATVISDEPRATLWEIPDRELLEFRQGSLIVVPKGTSIEITLPPNAEVVAGQISPDVKVTGNVISLGGISTNFINLRYKIPKPPITAGPGYAEAVMDFLSVPGNAVVLVPIVAVLALVVFYRKQIGERIEGYIIEHSEIEHREPEEMELEA
ncbi:MAG: hypothetical protein V1676_01840 [Candidatus Diapherotrites archaeon]